LNEDPEVLQFKEFQRQLAQRLTGVRNSDVQTKEDRLAGIETVHLEQAVETLVRKRMSQTASLLPRTVCLLGSRFEEEFRAFYACHHFNGPRAFLRDGFEFAAWSATRIQEDAVKVPTSKECALECCRFEALLCKWQYLFTFVKSKKFQWDIPTWEIGRRDHLAGKDILKDCPRGPIRVLWWRWGGVAGMRVWRSR
jgi:hypothetical protein